MVHMHLFENADMADLAQEQMKELNTDIMGLYVGTGWRILLIQNPELVKEVTVKNFSKFENRFDANENIYGVHGSIARDFLTLVTGARWRRLRHSTTPIMTQAKLANMLKLINLASETMVNEETTTGVDIEVNEWCGEYTIRAILAAVFSIDPTDHNQMVLAKKVILDLLPNEDMVSSMMMALIPERVRYFFGVSMYSKSSVKVVQKWIDVALDRQSKGQAASDFMSQMLKLSIDEKDKHNLAINKGFTRSEVLATSIISVGAGFETTRSTMEFIVAVIARHQDVQQKLVDHIGKMGEITYESLRDFVYLDAVIKESMRMYTPVPFNGRVCNETCTLSNGLTIEKGITVLWFSSWIQNDAEYFDQPDQFDPDRWCGNEKIGQETLYDDKWSAFGEGPRSCPGQRLSMMMMKSFLVNLIKKYKIVESEKSAKVLKVDFVNQVHFLKTNSREPILINVSAR